MEASAESDRVAGPSWRRKWSAEASFLACSCSVLSSPFENIGTPFSSSRWRLPKSNGRKSENGESDYAAILRGSMWQRQIDIDML